MSLTVLITNADGLQHHLGPFEADAAWIPENIQFESTVPGGWKSGSFNLRRRIDEDIPLRLLDEVEIVDEHGQNVYEGRIQQLPRQHGDDFLLGVNCLGWAAHLLDDRSFAQIYIDRDLSRWDTYTTDRHVALITAGFAPKSGPQVSSVAKTTYRAALELGGIDDPFPNGIKPIAEGWYDAGSCRLASVYAVLTTNGNPGSASWAVTMALTSESEDLSGGDTTLDMMGTVPGVTLAATTADRKFAVVDFYWDAATGVASEGNTYAVFLNDLRVIGTHGLTLQGAEPNTGFFIDDMLAHALGSACPKLNFSTGTGGSIERPAVVVPQAAFPEPGSVESVLLDLNKYVIWDWLVYENKTFFYRPTDPDRLTWQARLDRGVHLSLEGDDAERAYNGCVVRYQMADGTRRSAGPAGSGLDVESALLADTSPENTVNQHGYPKKWIELDIQFPLAADDYAITIGAAYLAQASLPGRSGDITLVGEVEHPTKGLRPVREVRAGDWIRLSDHPADVPRRIISSRYSHDQLQNVVSVGNDMNKIDALLEQLGVVTRVRLGG